MLNITELVGLVEQGNASTTVIMFKLYNLYQPIRWLLPFAGTLWATLSGLSLLYKLLYLGRSTSKGKWTLCIWVTYLLPSSLWTSWEGFKYTQQRISFGSEVLEESPECGMNTGTALLYLTQSVCCFILCVICALHLQKGVSIRTFIRSLPINLLHAPRSKYFYKMLFVAGWSYLFMHYCSLDVFWKKWICTLAFALMLPISLDIKYICQIVLTLGWTYQCIQFWNGDAFDKSLMCVWNDKHTFQQCLYEEQSDFGQYIPYYTTMLSTVWVSLRKQPDAHVIHTTEIVHTRDTPESIYERCLETMPNLATVRTYPQFLGKLGHIKRCWKNAREDVPMLCENLNKAAQCLWPLNKQGRQ